MIKNFIVIVAVTLMTSIAWADTPVVSVNSVIQHNNVNYKITSSTPNNPTPEEKTTKSLSFTNGVMTYTIDTKTTKDWVYSINVEATSLVSSSISVSIENFNRYPTDTNTSTGAGLNYNAGSSEYNTYMTEAAAIQNSGYTILSYEQTTTDKNSSGGNYLAAIYQDYTGTNQIDISNRNKYYYKKDATGDFVCTYTAINSIVLASKTTTINNYSCNYTTTSIAAGFINGQTVKYLNINNTELSEIKPGAIKDDVSFQSVEPNNNTNFIWDDNMLYDKNKKSVIVASATCGGQTLPESVTKIYDYAFCNLKNKYTIKSETLGIDVNKSTQGSNVTFNFPTALTPSLDSNGKGYSFTGSLNSTEFATIYSSNTYKDCLYLDFSDADIRGSIAINNTGQTTNRLYYFPNNASISGNYQNVVIGSNCSKFVMIDKKDFFCPKQFTAGEVSFSRTMDNTGKWGTVVLPYDITLDDSHYWIGGFKEYTGETLKFTKTTTMTANTPYIFKNDGGETTPFNVSSSKIIKVSDASPFGGTFKGTYEKWTVADNNNYGYSTTGKFVKCNGNTLYSFRGYFHVTGPGNAPEARYFDENDEEVFFEENASAIEDIDDTQNNTIYTLNGQQVNNTNKAGIYIINNKKVIIK